MAAILDFICKSWKYKFLLSLGSSSTKKTYLATKTTILSKLFHVLWQFSRFSFKMAAILDLPRLGVCRGVPTLFLTFFLKSYINWQLCRGYPDKTDSNIGPYYITSSMTKVKALVLVFISNTTEILQHWLFLSSTSTDFGLHCLVNSK